MWNIFSQILKKIGLNHAAPELTKSERSHDYFQGILGSCPLCGCGLQGHEVSTLASVFLDGEVDRLERLGELVRDRQWQEARVCQDWESTRDELFYYFLRCRQSGNIVLIRLVSEWALEGTDWVYEINTIDDENEIDRIAKLTDLEWIELEPKSAQEPYGDCFR